MCDGTGGPQGHEGGQQGLEQGGAEEMGQTETEERRQTGQPYKARKSKVLNETERNYLAICKEWRILKTPVDTKIVLQGYLVCTELLKSL